MEMDDLNPPTKKSRKKNLEVMSIEALGEYIEELKAEIARAEEAAAGKRDARSAAEAVFKS